METSYDTPTGVPSGPGEPTWEIAHLFPAQGDWSDNEFLALPAPHRFELSVGRLKVLPMPTWFHALIGRYLCKMVERYLETHDVGLVATAPLYVRLWHKEIRQPDVVFCFHERVGNRKQIQNGADLVFEVVSEGEENRARDLQEKRELYARAGFAEYWIVDPELRTITVLSLAGESYRVAGDYTAGTQAVSVLLPGFTVDVSATFSAGER